MRAAPPNLRTGVLAWSREQAHGEPRGLGWVDLTLREDGRPFLPVKDEATGEVRFRHAPYGLFLPPPMLQAAQEAAERGEATALHGVILSFAKPEWIVASRHLLWTPLSPVPRLLSPLVEAFGIDRLLHRDDPSRLVRLLAHLPRFHPHRGDPNAARQLVQDALDEDLGVEVRDQVDGDEVFACRPASWWRRRGGPPSGLVVRDGLLRCEAMQDAPQAEDAVLSPIGDASVPIAMLRLLPVWASVRLHPPSSPSASRRDAPPVREERP